MSKKGMNTKQFLYRLFFTRNDDMDLLQVMYLICILYFFVAFGLEAAGTWNVSTGGWDMFKWVMSILAMTGVPKWVVSIFAGKNSSAVAQIAAPDEDKKADDKDKG